MLKTNVEYYQEYNIKNFSDTSNKVSIYVIVILSEIKKTIFSVKILVELLYRWSMFCIVPICTNFSFCGSVKSTSSSTE